MLILLAHLILAIAAIAIHRKRNYEPKSAVLVLVWFLVSLVIIGLDLIMSEGAAASMGDFARGAIVSFFQLPPLYFALQWGSVRRRSPLGPILVYLVFSFASLNVVGLLFARADAVSGLSFLA